jgi:hypothetical protein
VNSDRPDPTPPEDPDHRLDIDAAFAEIVAHWEPSAPEDPSTPAAPTGPDEPEPGSRSGDPDAGPLLGLLSFVLRIRVPDWLTVGLVLGFVGGFVYLVATMRASGDDGWPGDDGAVL